MSQTPSWERIDTSAVIGRKLLGFAEVSSTMDIAWELAESSAAHGIGVLAEMQIRGRGRFGRHWVSPPGDALLLSVLLRPPSEIVPLLSISASLSVCGAVRDIAGVECAVKWPNDVYLDGRKLCGILAEARVSTEGDSAVVLGVGLNLDLDMERHSGLREVATSLRAATGHRYGMIDAAVVLLGHMDRDYSSVLKGDDLVGEWRRRLETVGKRVSVRQRDTILTGLAEDVDHTGRLLLRTDDGRVHVLMEGDVTLRPQ